MNGPTLNPSYNDLLKRWEASRQAILAGPAWRREDYELTNPGSLEQRWDVPECESCECDLTGCEVHEGRYGWYCPDCADTCELGCGFDSDDDYEARQMGLTDL
jgi:hypothetical protein